MKQQGTWVRAMAMFSYVVTDLVGSTGAGLALGWALVNYAQMDSIIYLPTALVGFALGMVRVFLRSKQVNDSEERGDQK